MTFETELIRAIEHGCPECGDDIDLRLYCLKEVGYSASLSQNGKGLVLWNETTIDESHETSNLCVECPKCEAELWTARGGWIPELQEIVKGE